MCANKRARTTNKNTLTTYAKQITYQIIDFFLTKYKSQSFSDTVRSLKCIIFY